MEKSSIILTPNKRLVSYLYAQLYPIIAEKGALTCSWDNIKILPLTTWLTELWQECQDPRVLLTPNQERVLWRQIITKNLGDEFSSITGAVMETYNLLLNWELTLPKQEHYYITEDIAAFKKLYHSFTSYCAAKNLIVTAQLPSLLPPYLQYLKPYSPTEIVFTDFTEYYPSLQRLLKNLEASAYQIKHVNSKSYTNNKNKKIKLDKQSDEIYAAARWASQLSSNNSKITLGIIVPNLANLRAEIVRIFTEVLGDERLFKLSLGAKLTSLPLIAAALLLLRASIHLNLAAVSRLLLSPHIRGASTERAERALLNAKWRQLKEPQFTLNELIELINREPSPPPLLLETLTKVAALLANYQKQKLYNSNWAELFAQILQSWGWPGEDNLTAAEEASVTQFTTLLAEFATTNLITAKTSYQQALELLADLVQNSNSQPPSNEEAPITLLGTLEAVGIRFDYLWLMGLDHENWPSPHNPTPFLPITLQRKYKLPHSSYAQELHFYQTLTNHFKQNAATVIFSYSTNRDDHQVKASSLISEIPEISLAELPLCSFTSPKNRVYASKAMELFTDATYLPLTTNAQITGGSRLLEQQALCPFRAFAEFRLRAQEPSQAELGVSRMERGTLIHLTLEGFWQEIKTQNHLATLLEQELNTILQKHVRRALTKLGVKPPIAQIEQKCLLYLLQRWLTVEKSRDPFEVVTTEKTVWADLGPLTIKLRIDRIDRLPSGELLLLDYKTGKNLPTAFDWFGQRPKQPQLPLYCLALKEAKSFAFAQINVASVKFKPIELAELKAGLQTVAPSLTSAPTWDDMITHWRTTLIQLAENFVAGQVQPTPLTPQVCVQCPFSLICRNSQAP